MKYFSVDIGSRNVGLAIAKISDTEKTLVGAKSIYLEPKAIQDRMPILLNEMKRLIDTHKPEHIILELPFLRGQNLHDVYFCTGLIYLLSGEYKLPISKITATEAKKLVTNSGKASKEDMELAVRKFYNLTTSYSFDADHSSDAASFPIAHFLKSGATV